MLGVVRRRSSKVPWASMSHEWISIEESPFLYFVGVANSNSQLSRRDFCAGKHNVMALWNYVCFGGYQEHDTTNTHAETVQSLYGDQGPLRPGNSHIPIHKVLSSLSPDSYKLVYFSETQTTSATIIPRLKNVLPTPCDIPHLTLSLSRPILVHSSIHLHRRPSSVKSKPTPNSSTIPSSPLNTPTETAAALVSDASITIVNLRQCQARTMLPLRAQWT